MDELSNQYRFSILENNRLINPPAEVLRLSGMIYLQIKPFLEKEKKLRPKYRDYLTFKLQNLLVAHQSSKLLAYSRDYNFYRKFYSCKENQHFWNYMVVIQVSDALMKAGYIRQKLGYRGYFYNKGICTIITQEMKLLELLMNISSKCPTLSNNRNPIELRKKAKRKRATKKKGQVPILYKETDHPYLPKIRRELKLIQDFYNKQKIGGFVPTSDLTEDVSLLHEIKNLHRFGKIRLQTKSNGYEFIIVDRLVRRIFQNGTFLNGGRLYASWQNIPKIIRPYILINGEKIGEYDYSACQIKMLYHMMLKNDPPFNDVYRLAFTNLKIAKMAAIISLNASGERGAAMALIKYSKENSIKSLNFKDALKVIKLFKKKHWNISEYINSGAGIILMRIESEIMVRIILNLIQKNICVLPIHDSCVFPIGSEDDVYDAMIQEYYHVLKFYPAIKRAL
jgi:hypothetical protein